MTSEAGPLAGIRVVEFDAIGPVPIAGMVLADMGAEVVRIVRPASMATAWDDVGAVVLHRGRKFVALDLKQAEAREQVLALVTHADALIEGFRPGVLERLGLGPKVCLRANPKLVYTRVTGWGQTGPLSQRAGHDLNYIAITGVLHAMGSADLPPPVPLNLIGDYAGGTMFGLIGMLAALLHAQRSGIGQVVDVAITDGVGVLAALFRAYLATGMWKDERGANLLDGSAPFYRCYRCADGEFVAVGALEPQFFSILIDGLGMAQDNIVQYDQSTWPALIAKFEEIFSSRPRGHWADLFSDKDACLYPVLSFTEAVGNSHLLARHALPQQEDGVVQPAPAPRFSATPATLNLSSAEVAIDELVTHWAAKLNL